MLAYGGGEAMANKYSIPFLGRIPIEPNLAACTETGQNYMAKFSSSDVAQTYTSIAKRILESKGITLDADTAMDVDQ